MHYIQGKNRAEIELFPQVENWISKDNPVRLIDLIVDKLILSNTEKFIWKGESNTGRKSYSPSTMLKLFLYGYLNRIASSRRIETETYRNLEMMWLLNDLHPDHWTINEYRKKNKDQIRFVTIEFRRFLKAEGYIEGKKVATDGSKFKAYAAKDMLSIENINKRLEKVNEKLENYLDELKANDTLEDLIEDFDNNPADMDLNKSLISKIANLQEKVEQLESDKQKLKEANKKYLAPNDPDANLMKSRDGKIPAYNGQTVIDDKYKMIAVAEITTEATDINELKNNLNTLNEQLDIVPEIVEADKGYCNFQDIKSIEEAIEQESKTECVIPVPKNHKKEKDNEEGINFTYNSQEDEYECSEGKKLKLKSKNKKQRNHKYDVYQGIDCNNCSKKDKCTKSKQGRILKRNKIEDWINNYKNKVKKAKDKILERKSIVEHPFGTIKWMMGKLHFLLTGKEKVQIEFDLYATAYNLKRLINIDNMEILLQKAENYNWKQR